MTRAPFAIAYGGGGPLATAFGMGVAGGLVSGGVCLAGAPALGTSGGAWAAAAARSGLSHDDVVEVTGRVQLPDLRPGRLRRAGFELFGTRSDPLLWTSTVRVRGGRRTLLWGGDHSVAAIVAASSAVPMMVLPEWVGREPYLDGGARSWISADLAPDADRLIVVAPGIAPSFGRFGRLLRRQLGFELRRWKRRTGGRITVVRFGDELGRRVTRWKHLFDGALVAQAYNEADGLVGRELEPGGRLHDLLRP